MKTPKEHVLTMLKKYLEVLRNYDDEYDSEAEITRALEQQLIIEDLINYLKNK